MERREQATQTTLDRLGPVRRFIFRKLLAWAQNIGPSREDALAAVAHGSVIAQGIGILAGVLVYINQRDKSRYAAFQALQAAVFQLVNLTITIGIWLVWGVFYGLSMIPLIQQADANPDAAPPAIFWISMISMVIPLSSLKESGMCSIPRGAKQNTRQGTCPRKRCKACNRHQDMN